MLAYPQSPPKPPQLGPPMTSPRKGVSSPYQHQRGPSSGRTPIADMMAHTSPSKHQRQSSYGWPSALNNPKSPGKENSPHPDSPSMDRWAFPSAQTQAKTLGPLSPSVGTPQLLSSADYYPENDQPSGCATVTRGRAVRRKEPLKTGDEPVPDGSSVSSPQKKMLQKEWRSKSRQRMASGGDVSSGSAPGKARTFSSGSATLSKEVIDADFINLLVSRDRHPSAPR